jgi:tight adherence protein B
MLSTVVFLFFLFLTYAVFLLASRKSEARHARLQHRVDEALQVSLADETPEASFVRRESISSNPTLNRLLGSADFVKRLEVMLAQADVQITVSRLLAFCIVAGVMAALAVYTVVSSLPLVVVAGVVAAVTPVLHVAWKRKRRLQKFLEHLPDALDMMSRSLAVGHALSESLNQVASDMPEPIATEFRITFEEQKLGLSTKLAFEHMYERIPLLDLRLCITAILVQRETGGNLAEVLDKVASTIRERFKLMEDFRTITTSARGSAWILCGLPFVIVLALTAINPDYMKPLLYDSRGHLIIAAASVMQLVGMIVIRSILKIKI